MSIVIGPILSTKGRTDLYAVLMLGSQVYNRALDAFESLASANSNDYDYPLIEQGSAGVYLAVATPTSVLIERQRYVAVVFDRAGASPVIATDPTFDRLYITADEPNVNVTHVLGEPAILQSVSIIQQGNGADEVTLTIKRVGSGIPIPDADVWITSTLDPIENVVAGTFQTNSDGKITALLDDGNSYYLWMQKDGENPIIGQPFTAVKD